MNSLDILLLIPLVIAAVSGWRNGLIVQACGIAGLIVGIILALHFSHAIALWLNLSDDLPPIVAFVLIVAICVAVLWGLGYLFKCVFRLSGFGLFDRIGGMILGVVKIGLLLSVLVSVVIRIDTRHNIISHDKIDNSKVYHSLHAMTDAVFPYVVKAKDLLFESLGGGEDDNCDADDKHTLNLFG